MGVIGAIEDGIRGNYTILLVKGVIDGIIVMVMCSFMGRGAMFSFIPVGVVQIIITILAYVSEPFITKEAMNNLSYVGSILIFCVGLNLLWPDKIRVANLLPAIFIAMALSYVPWIP
ncbi:DUF554 family protein [Veillonella sp.]|jgi:uncharacterized membrane protein YqgA involved in biofilm formation|uniref:DUF554 family protein n=1 Tax=Veillonella sp. TaxID=1926307 RepID=UPI0025FE55EB|nr:DUF554 family protein [Veillonella sp.]